MKIIFPMKYIVADVFDESENSEELAICSPADPAIECYAFFENGQRTGEIEIPDMSTMMNFLDAVKETRNASSSPLTLRILLEVEYDLPEDEAQAILNFWETLKTAQKAATPSQLPAAAGKSRSATPVGIQQA